MLDELIDWTLFLSLFVLRGSQPPARTLLHFLKAYNCIFSTLAFISQPNSPKIYAIFFRNKYFQIAAKVREGEWMGIGLSSGQTMDHGIIAYLLCKPKKKVMKAWLKG